MASRVLQARAQIENREWIDVKVTLSDSDDVVDVEWSALGCHALLENGRDFASALKSKKLLEFRWGPKDEPHHHSALLIQDILMKLQGRFKFPYEEEELCHCRKVPAKVVDQAIILGAHTPEKVKAWTSASSQCGTCRPDVQKVLSFRLKSS